jgi:hypothetical protein
MLCDRLFQRRGIHARIGRAPYQIGADGSADQSACHDAAHRGHDGDGGGRGHARLLERRRERQSCGRTAGERDRARKHAHERMLTECDGDARADDVLHERHAGREKKEDDDRSAADAQQRNACAEANRREERDLHRRLQRRIKSQRIPEVGAVDREQDRDEQSTHYWSRDVVGGKRRNDTPDEIAREQHHARKRDGLNQVQ